MEPWLDSLSEDWKSDQHFSSLSVPQATPDRPRDGGVVSKNSQSRIPHLIQNRRIVSRSRSPQTLASDHSHVLAEHTSSKLNVAAQQHVLTNSSSQERYGASSLPRRPSTAFSASVQSVQYHTIQWGQNGVEGAETDTPEWRRKLVRGKETASDVCDLFSPSRLEGIFRLPTQATDISKSSTCSEHTPQKLWSLPPSSSARASDQERFQSSRASRSRKLNLDIVEEVPEDKASAGSPASTQGKHAPSCMLRGIVRERVASLELISSPRTSTTESLKDSPTGKRSWDPRSRTVSGQEDLRNEEISPVTVSKQNTIRDRALRHSLDESVKVLQSKLAGIGGSDLHRPSSRSSDYGVHYGHGADGSVAVVEGKNMADMTTHSLPEDLSMGTMDFISEGNVVKNVRGGCSTEGSSLRRTLDFSATKSRQTSFSHRMQRSPPSPATATPIFPQGGRHLAMNSPSTPGKVSLVDQDSIPSTSKSGSPLKLFGVHDTFTNNFLQRRMSKFEEVEPDVEDTPMDPETDLRISHFGRGDLDKYDFDHKMERQVSSHALQADHEARNFASTHTTSKPQAVAQNPRLSRPPSNGKPVSNLSSERREPQGDEPPKRVTNSPLKDRTPKRRRTLLRDDTEVQIERRGDAVEFIQFTTQIGTAAEPRRDAPYGTEAAISEAMAHDLAHLSIGGSQIALEARKPSVTTQDYMNEATKIMQLIRQRGKPQSALRNVEEPPEDSELDPDAILDLDIDGETTQDNFSRPPSRDGAIDLRRIRGHFHQDPRVVSHLQKYRDVDDLEVLAVTSVLGSFPVREQCCLDDTAIVPAPHMKQQSSPANIRLVGGNFDGRKRKHSSSTAGPAHFSHLEDVLQTCNSSEGSTARTVPTTSSSDSTGRKGMIVSGKLEIPDQIGPMVFDHAAQTWVKAKEMEERRDDRHTNSDEDPFESIPDLSIEDQKDRGRGTASQSITSLQTAAEHSKAIHAAPCLPPRLHIRDGAVVAPTETGSNETQHTRYDSTVPNESSRTSSNTTNANMSKHLVHVEQRHSSWRPDAHSEDVEHEIRIHEGRFSQAPQSPDNINRRARVVTIAFSSPLVSAVACQEAGSVSEPDWNGMKEPSKEDADPRLGYQGTCPKTYTSVETRRDLERRGDALDSAQPRMGNGTAFLSRPISRIEERDEDITGNDLSIVRLSKPLAITPVATEERRSSAALRTNGNASSLLRLTPLPDFSLHQQDDPVHVEMSYIAPRAHPTSLRQAHGSLALAVDDMIKAITDVLPHEHYWEQIRSLDLTRKSLTTLHRLSDYCSALEELTISENQISQLSGVPTSVRILNVKQNCLSNLTSWAHLQNLQYVDVSSNHLESLDGLGSLVHMRELKAEHNMITNIDGILNLNGLLSLALRGNELTKVDFEGAELTRLCRLDLSHNHLTSVCGLESLPALEDINLERNQLGILPVGQNGAFKSLRRINLSTNHLRNVDLLLFPSLEVLYLDNNLIEKIDGLAVARHLRVLSLREQSDSPGIIEHVLSNMNECRKLYLSSNTVTDGTLTIRSPPLLNLQYLELAACGITRLDAQFGNKVPNCRVLNLNFNAIAEIRPIQGAVQLNKLLVAGNRINRLRRTCLTLSRFPALRKLDVRDNPLTVGFYGPRFKEERMILYGALSTDDHDGSHLYMIPPRSDEADKKWVKLLDEGTKMRRRTTELMIAEGCETLLELDGLRFEQESVLQPDETWSKLTRIGVLKRPELVGKGVISCSEKRITHSHAKADAIEGNVGGAKSTTTESR